MSRCRTSATPRASALTTRPILESTSPSPGSRSAHRLSQASGQSLTCHLSSQSAASVELNQIAAPSQPTTEHASQPTGQGADRLALALTRTRPQGAGCMLARASVQAQLRRARDGMREHWRGQRASEGASEQARKRATRRAGGQRARQQLQAQLASRLAGHTDPRGQTAGQVELQTEPATAVLLCKPVRKWQEMCLRRGRPDETFGRTDSMRSAVSGIEKKGECKNSCIRRPHARRTCSPAVARSLLLIALPPSTSPAAAAGASGRRRCRRDRNGCCCRNESSAVIGADNQVTQQHCCRDPASPRPRRDAQRSLHCYNTDLCRLRLLPDRRRRNQTHGRACCC